MTTLPPIETEEMRVGSPPREYIPLPGGWEIQTKGGGSSYRLCDIKTGERHMILCADISTIHDFVTRMAKEIRIAHEAAIEAAIKAERERCAGVAKVAWLKFDFPHLADADLVCDLAEFTANQITSGS